MSATSAIPRQRVLALAIEAGFEKYERSSLSAAWNGNAGKEDDDETLQVGEYPVGCAVLKFAELLQAEAAKRRG